MLGGSAFEKSNRMFMAKERPEMLRKEALLVNVAGRGVGLGPGRFHSLRVHAPSPVSAPGTRC